MSKINCFVVYIFNIETNFVKFNFISNFFLVPKIGLEPIRMFPFRLFLRQLCLPFSPFRQFIYCVPRGIRTLDPEIKSFVLYQLSYEHIINKVHFGQAVSYSKTKFEYSAQFISIVFFFGGTMNI